MTQPQQWWKGPRRYAGLLLMGLFVLTGLASGILAFEKVVTTETAYGAMTVSFFVIGLPGFILHMVTVIRTRNSNGA